MAGRSAAPQETFSLGKIVLPWPKRVKRERDRSRSRELQRRLPIVDETGEPQKETMRLLHVYVYNIFSKSV